ncbi:glycoside hydrolase superfamily [Nemania serpens]|nr:glycoside hydrolase superfamily [Nemania serpens]
MHTIALLAALASATSVAAKLGFNYGSTFTTGAAKAQADFEAEFTTAANLKGTSGWTSARLYTMVQGGTASDPISAIPAAIKTGTTLLLGLWASAGDAAFANELFALKAAIGQYGKDLAGIVDGISVGSEDLYRSSPQGIAAGSNPGVSPDVLVRYISQVKDAIAGTALEGALIGHVDTWTAWDDPSSGVVVEALDWLGMDAYPYFQNTMPNAIGQSKSLFDSALGRTRAAAGGKAVWVTETGQPVSGKTSGGSVASLENAENYWKTVGCPMFGNTNVWWYTLQDAAPDTPNPSFGIIGSELTTTPLFDLSCDDVGSGSPPSSSTTTAAATTTTTTAPSSSSSSSSSVTSTSKPSNTTPTTTDGGATTTTKTPPNETTTGGSTETTSAQTTSGAASSSGPGSGSDSGSGSSSNSAVNSSPSSSGGGSATPTPTSSTAPTGSSPPPDNAAPGLQSGSSFAVVFAGLVAFFAL